ncbi:MAG: thermonuclease family protein [Phycisphaerales bacterium]|nr:thermonuclease family protein [Phycisphaerales bacterium]
MMLFMVLGIFSAEGLSAQPSSNGAQRPAELYPRKPMPEVVKPDEDQLVRGVVHRVIDGDSVELFLSGQIVAFELAGADAPEILDHPQRVLHGSAEAKQILEQLVLGEEIAVLPDRRRPTDARDRRRGYLYRMPDGLFVNLEMVRLGHAKHARDPLGFNNQAMLWAQDRARSARKGVWAPPPVQAQQTTDRLSDSNGDDGVGGETTKTETSTLSSIEAVDTATEAEEKPQAKDDEQGVVYVTKSGTKYHRKDCQHARATGVAKRRSELDPSMEPCKVCEPDAVDE